MLVSAVRVRGARLARPPRGLSAGLRRQPGRAHSVQAARLLARLHSLSARPRHARLVAHQPAPRRPRRVRRAEAAVEGAAARGRALRLRRHRLVEPLRTARPVECEPAGRAVRPPPPRHPGRLRLLRPPRPRDRRGARLPAARPAGKEPHLDDPRGWHPRYRPRAAAPHLRAALPPPRRAAAGPVRRPLRRGAHQCGHCRGGPGLRRAYMVAGEALQASEAGRPGGGDPIRHLGRGERAHGSHAAIALVFMRYSLCEKAR
mmetsp:Transcript_48820/g.157776  ORF Transcript_48820/g.157776 Transcript_48820/m.157776 type:complete len:260 (-) Transcript_48820:55-834(-)